MQQYGNNLDGRDRLIMDEPLFDERGQLSNSITRTLDEKGRLDGEPAIAFLAEVLADQTMENYAGKTLYDRAKIGQRYRVIVERL